MSVDNCANIQMRLKCFAYLLGARDKWTLREGQHYSQVVIAAKDINKLRLIHSFNIFKTSYSFILFLV